MSTYNSDIRDGDYVAEIVSMTSTKTSRGIPVVEWRLRIIGGEYDGEEVTKKFYLSDDSEKRKSVMDFLTKEFKMLGLDVKDSDDFLAKKDQCTGMRINIEAVTNKDGWQSYYVHGVVDEKAEEKKSVDSTGLGW
ncbi:MAG TPA: DUF669 domain-containing protein [Candidatus Hydrogenedentes bacterium]|mgnify:CR=1 FL=1|nr:DUF669 domain-containing protein [Candidatus Hydrogenedentota bacterium]HPG68286.1 DUF669 domain-containing protein [Candidatus Hydrogenedentota bacterium]